MEPVVTQDFFFTHTKQSGLPFKLGTTSFIFPDHIIPNVEKLGPFFDEIELLVFESQPPSSLPGEKEVQTLLSLSRKLDVTYNVHLPVDVSLTHPSSAARQKTVTTLSQVISLFSLLDPTTFTLHLEMAPEAVSLYHQMDRQDIKKWQKRIEKSLASLLSHIKSPGLISIETLDYPFKLVEPLIDEFHLSVCLDIGHQIKYGHDLLKTYEDHQDRITIIHLHGVDFSQSRVKDHLGLNALKEPYISRIKTILKDFKGVVSLEVFNRAYLNNSLTWLNRSGIVPLKIQN